jgi:hypothetical protein
VQEDEKEKTGDFAAVASKSPVLFFIGQHKDTLLQDSQMGVFFSVLKIKNPIK